MVPRREGDVAAARIFCGAHQFRRPIRFGAELLSRRVIGLVVDLQAEFCPLALSMHTVKAKMDKHAEAHFLKIQNSRTDQHFHFLHL